MRNLVNWYLKPRKIEGNGKIYEIIGVKLFLKLTPFELLNRLKNQQTKTIKNKKSLLKYFHDTILGELAHVASSVVLLVIGIVFIFDKLFKVAMIIFVVNMFLNLYPIFLMRYNRLRIAKILNKEIPVLLEKKEPLN